MCSQSTQAAEVLCRGGYALACIGATLCMPVCACPAKLYLTTGKHLLAALPIANLDWTANILVTRDRGVVLSHSISKY